MSAQQTFIYCHDCDIMEYGIPDKNGVFQRETASSSHAGHDVHIFGDPFTYQPPIRWVLLKLHAKTEISAWDMGMFDLAIALGELDDHRRINPAEGRQQFEALHGKKAAA